MNDDDDPYGAFSMSQRAQVEVNMTGRVDFGSLSIPPDNVNLGGATASSGILSGASCPSRKRGKFFNDSVHGMYRLDSSCVAIIDTPEFQRLRDLKQLGLSYYVFPGASHNRFEHSLGTAHLAEKVMLRIWEMQRKELGMEQIDIKRVMMAGLCHDLGHGPFSHVFDREFLPRCGIHDWSHEEMSCKIIDHLVDENNLDCITGEDAVVIKNLIHSDHRPAHLEKNFMYEVVANYSNSLDVDKFDYLQRDALMCGVKVSCDVNRLQQFSKVIDDRICYKCYGDKRDRGLYRSEYSNLMQVFHSRAKMHGDVYTHRKAKSIEFMVVDALCEADKVLKFTDKIHTAREFIRLDDSLLKRIEFYEDNYQNLVDDGHDAPLKKAAAIIKLLRKREHYRYCNEIVVPAEVVASGNWKAPAAIDIVGCYRGSVAISLADVIVHESKIDYSMGLKNPLDKVGFFDNFDSTTWRSYHQQHMQSMMPANFQERRLRVYTRNPTIVTALSEALQAFSDRRFGKRTVPLTTPCKTRRTSSEDVESQHGLLHNETQEAIRHSEQEPNAHFALAPGSTQVTPTHSPVSSRHASQHSNLLSHGGGGGGGGRAGSNLQSQGGDGGGQPAVNQLLQVLKPPARLHSMEGSFVSRGAGQGNSRQTASAEGAANSGSVARPTLNGGGGLHARPQHQLTPRTVHEDTEMLVDSPAVGGVSEAGAEASGVSDVQASDTTVKKRSRSLGPVFEAVSS